MDCGDRATHMQSRRPRSQQDSIERRADRAEASVCMGELSAQREILEGAPVAPGDGSTLLDLRNPVWRPPQLRAPLSEDLLTAQPEVPLELDQAMLVKNLKSARRESRWWPFWHDCGTLAPLLDSISDSDKFWILCQDLRVPHEVLSAEDGSHHRVGETCGRHQERRGGRFVSRTVSHSATHARNDHSSPVRVHRCCKSGPIKMTALD